MNKNLVTRAAIVTLCFSLLCLPAASQKQDKQPDDSVKISAQLVQLNIIVSDKSGKLIGGLTRDDFQLLDNNQPQSITHFAYEEIGGKSGETAGESVARRSSAPTSANINRIVAFVVDNLHMSFDSVFRTRALLQDFVDNQMQSGDLVLILPTAGGAGLYQQFSSDKRLLRRAIARLRSFQARSSSGVNTSAMTATLRSAGGGGLPPTGPQAGPRRTGSLGSLANANTPDPVETDVSMSTLHTLDTVIHDMSRLPGHKISMMISDGFKVNRETETALNETTALAGRVGVVFYTMDPRGLLPLSAGADTGQDDAFGDVSNGLRTDFKDTQDSLSAIAYDTGGKFYHDANELKTGMTQFLAENSAYYVLAFQPDGQKWDGKFHKLKISIKGHPEYQVQTMKGYFAKDENSVSRPGRDAQLSEAMEAISSPLTRREIDLQLTPFYVDNGQHEATVINLLHMDTGNLHFEQVDGKYQDHLETTAVVVDLNGRVVDSSSSKIDLNLSPDSYQDTIKRGLLWTRGLTLKPGTYQVRTLVKEVESGRLGTANNFIDIPDMKGTQLALSSIFANASLDQQNAAASKGTISQRRFKSGEKLEYYYIIYNAKGAASGQPELQSRLRIMGGTKVIFSGPVKTVGVTPDSTPPGRIVAGGVLQLGQMAPGDYTLEITVVDGHRKKDKNGVARQELDFSIE